MSKFCRVYACPVPEPHRHQPPNKAEVAESRYALVIEHPPQCAWRKDIYDGCSCGVTGLVMQLQDAMKPSYRSAE